MTFIYTATVQLPDGSTHTWSEEGNDAEKIKRSVVRVLAGMGIEGAKVNVKLGR